MSATGRGSDYDALGRYYTPEALADVVVRQLPIRSGDEVYEGHVGSGAWVKALASLTRFGVRPTLSINDVDPGAPGLDMQHYAWAESPFGWWTASVKDFLEHEPREKPNWVLGNPPYAIKGDPVPCPRCKGVGSIPTRTAERQCPKCEGLGERRLVIPAAEAHTRRALQLVKPTRGSVVYLLRSAFTESIERIPFWKEYPCRHRWDLSERPSFTGGGTDSSAYSVFWWDLAWLDAGNGKGDSTWEVLSWAT